MVATHSHKELADIAVEHVDALVQQGMCGGCALTMTANEYDCDRDKLEAIWLDYKLEK